MKNYFNCIYLYTNKVNGKKYVGQAVDFIKRHKSHIRQAYNEKCKAYNQYFHNAIRKYGIENFIVEILKEDLQTQDELNYWECYYIVEFDTLANNGKGYNLAKGGEGGNMIAGKTEEEKAERSRKISEANKETWNNKTDEEKAERSRKISKAMKNKSDEEKAETRAKQSEAKKGEKHPRATLVDRFDKQGNYVDTKYQFEYVEQMRFSASHISDCCKGKRKTHKGFIFKYHEE